MWRWSTVWIEPKPFTSSFELWPVGGCITRLISCAGVTTDAFSVQRLGLLCRPAERTDCQQAKGSAQLYPLGG